MDHVLYRNESRVVTMYDRHGRVDESITFGSQEYLNRIAGQYVRHSKCNGGKAGDCLTPDSKPAFSPWKLATAWDLDQTNPAPDLTCDGVPAGKPDSWWGGYMSYPTFSAFVAPLALITPEESVCWMDTFSCICNVKTASPTGPICQTTYFDLSQSVISTMIMAMSVTKLEDAQQVSPPDTVQIITKQTLQNNNPLFPVGSFDGTGTRALLLPGFTGLAVLSALGLVLRHVYVRRNWRSTEAMLTGRRMMHGYESIEEQHQQHLTSPTHGSEHLVSRHHLQSSEVQQQEQDHASRGLDWL